MANGSNIVNARIQLKNDIEANWDLAVNFVPRQGELIIYNAESGDDEIKAYPRFKVGDGSTTVVNLPFIKGLGATMYAQERIELIDLSELSGLASGE